MSLYDFTDDYGDDFFYVRMIKPKVAICSYDYDEIKILMFNNDKKDNSFFRYNYCHHDHYHDFVELALHTEFMDQIDELIFYFPEDTYRISKIDFFDFVSKDRPECFL